MTAMPKTQQAEIEYLKRQAEHLWEQQQEVLAQAADLAKAAGRTASQYSREEIAPRVREAVSTGTDSVRTLASTARSKLVSDVIPGVTSAFGTALATIDALTDREVRAALARIARLRGQVASAPAPVVVAPAPKPKVFPWVLLGIGVVAAGAVAYVAWQTLRADDDLWVEDEEDELEEPAEESENSQQA